MGHETAVVAYSCVASDKVTAASTALRMQRGGDGGALVVRCSSNNVRRVVRKGVRKIKKREVFL